MVRIPARKPCGACIRANRADGRISRMRMHRDLDCGARAAYGAPCMRLLGALDYTALCIDRWSPATSLD